MPKVTGKQKIKEMMVQGKKVSIVKYSNDLDLNALGQLSSNEQDIFINILATFCSERKTKLEIDLGELKSLSGLSGQNNNYFIDKLTTINENLIKKLTYTMLLPDNERYSAPVFQDFLISPKKGTLVTNINPRMGMALLFGIEGSFTKYQRLTFMKFRSKYAKSLFRLLARNHKGHFVISLDEFKYAMALPESYSATNLRKLVKKAVKELEDKYYGPDAIKVTYTHSVTRGNPVNGIEFAYPPEGKFGQVLCTVQPDEDGFPVKMVSEKKSRTEQYIRDDGLPGLREVNVIKSVPKKCPKCGAPVGEFVAESGEHAGERYEICKNNHQQIQYGGNGKCDYFCWVPDVEIITSTDEEPDKGGDA